MDSMTYYYEKKASLLGVINTIADVLYFKVVTHETTHLVTVRLVFYSLANKSN